MKPLLTLFAIAAFLGGHCSAAEPNTADPKRQLPRPDGRPADQTKKVKVFILMGQSNMVGMGDINPADKPGTLTTLTKTEKKYPYLLDDAGQWSVRKDVYYYDARVKKGSPLSATSNGNSIGPELGFGFVMGQCLEEPVLIMKSCTGNRSLGSDLLPPGSERYTAEVIERGGLKVTKTFAGYQDTPDSWVEGQPKKEVAWYAGKQYDDDMANAKAALAKGVHVLTEKPMCLTTHEADQIIEAARAQNRVVAVDMHKRYDPDHLRIRDDIQKRIGAPLYGTAFLEEPLEVSTSTFKWVESSDPFSYVGPHWVDLIYHYYKSKPVSLTAVGQKKRLVRDGINAYDAVQVHVDFDNGMSINFRNNWITPPDFEGPVNQGHEIVGADGKVEDADWETCASVLNGVSMKELFSREW